MVLGVSLAVLLVVVVLGTVLYEIGSHAIVANQARLATAMQLYQQVMSRHPTINDALTGSPSSWSTYQRAPWPDACKWSRGSGGL